LFFKFCRWICTTILRLYNRFEAVGLENIPPAGGATTIGLFKPGAPASVNASTVVPSADGLFHPLNDSCANAADVFAGSTAFGGSAFGTVGGTSTNGGWVFGTTGAGAFFG
jgi:hypothetical protein